MSRESFRDIERRPELGREREEAVARVEGAPESPTIVAIYTSPMTTEPMVSHTEIESIAGEGLAGDRYNSGDNMNGYRGYYRDHRIPNTDRQVTLIATGGIEDGNRLLAERGLAPMRPEDVRRNLVINMDAATLNGFVGQRFQVGDVVMEAVELCTPCVRPPTYLGRAKDGSAFVKGYLPNGGIRARIVSGGSIRTGANVSVIGPTPAVR